MKLKLLYFASLREQVGINEEQVNVPASVLTMADLRAWLVARGGVWASALGNHKLRAAVQQRMVGEDAAVAEGDEVAFFPPVTGG